MRLGIRTFLAGLAVLAAVPAADAAFVMRVQETGGPVIDVPFSGPTPSSFQVDVNALNGLLTNFAFDSLSADSNSTTGGGVLDAVLGVNGSLRQLNTGDFSITITVSDTDFGFPPLTPGGTLISAATDTYSLAAGNRTFESFFGPNNQEYEEGIAAPIVSYSLTGTGDGGDKSTVGVTDADNIYSLTNRSVISLGLAGAQTRFGGVTTVSASAVPEPASLVMAGLGLLALPALAIRRARRNAN